MFLSHVQQTVSGSAPPQHPPDTINWTLSRCSLRVSSKQCLETLPCHIRLTPSAGHCLETKTIHHIVPPPPQNLKCHHHTPLGPLLHKEFAQKSPICIEHGQRLGNAVEMMSRMQACRKVVDALAYNQLLAGFAKA